MVRAAALTAIVLVLCVGCGGERAHDRKVRDLAGNKTNIGRLDEGAVRIKLGAPDLRKTDTVAGVR